MGYKVLIDTIENTTATVVSIEENLNGHIEAIFWLPNNATNRTLVGADHAIEITYNAVSEFKGILKDPEFQQDRLLCKCYQTAIELAQRKVHTGDYSAVNPATIFAAICADAGVVAGVCPTTPTVSAHFNKACCYDAARYLAWVLGTDLYPDFSGASPRLNIGTAGTGSPGGRGLLHYTITPKRTKSRAKKRDKVYVRGQNALGASLTGSAGTGTDVAVFTDRTATTQATLDALAAKYLADLNTDSTGCPINCSLEGYPSAAYVRGYDLHAGDYVTITCAELGYSVTVVRVFKVTKYLTSVLAEVEKAEMLLDDYLEKAEAWEDLGIYPPASVAVPDIDPVLPTGFGTDDVVVATTQSVDGTFISLFAVTVHRISGMTGYKIRWQKQGASVWEYSDVMQPAAGDAVAYTGPVVMGSVYDLQVASFNMDGKVSAYTANVPKTVTNDTTAPAVPSGVTATTSGLKRAIKITFTAVSSVDLRGYKLYRYTSDVPGSAVEIARAATNYFVIDSDIVTPYYFWVSSYDSIGNESAKSTLATGCPVTGQKEDVTDVNDVAPAVPAITCVAGEVDTATAFRTWIQVTVVRVTNAGGYVVEYKKTSDTQWTSMYVGQPTAGNPIITTPDLEANTSYDFRACSVSMLGLCSAWCTVSTLSSLANSTALTAPSGLTATAVEDGVLLEWTYTASTDFSHFIVYYGTVTPPMTVYAQSSRPYCLWKKKPAEAYTGYYFGVVAVDSAGNLSTKTTTAGTTTPTLVQHVDIAPNAIEVDNILDGAVQEAKIGALAVSEAKIAANAVVAGKIKDAEIVWAKLAASLQAIITAAGGIFYEAEALTYAAPTTLVVDATASGGNCLARLTATASGSMWTGPSTTAAGNNYWALFRLKVTSNASGSSILTISVTATRGTLGTRTLKPNEFDASGVWQTFAIPVEIRTNDTAIQLTGTSFVTGITDIYCDCVALVKMAKISTDLLEAYAITTGKLAALAVTADKIAAGAITTEKLSVSSIALESFVWTNNSPTDSVSWSVGTVYYQGAAHSVGAGTCDVGDRYIYWDHATPTVFGHSVAKPSYSDTLWLIAVNEGGLHRLVNNATCIQGGVIVAGTVTATQIAANTITADKLLAGTITGAYQNTLMPEDKVFKIAACGISYSGDQNKRGVRDGRTAAIIAQAARSYMVSVFNRTTQVWVSHTTYDVAGGTANATTMANALNALTDTSIVVIHTFDEPQGNRLFGTLPAAMYRCGATREIYGASTFKYCSAYILVGIPGCGEGNGIELYNGAIDSDTTAYCETTIAIQNGNILNIRKGSLLEIAADKIVISGTVYLTNWRKTGDLTKIDGGSISAGTILLTGLEAGVQGRLFTDTTLKGVVEGWRSGVTTYIDGGDIYTGSIAVSSLDTATQGRLFTDPTLKTVVEGWRSGTTTYIDGADIYTGSIATTSLNTATQNRLFTDATLKSVVEGWRQGVTTYISGGSIYTGSIATTALDATTQSRLFTDPTLKTVVEGWRQGVTTYINGGQIYTGSIAATQLDTSTQGRLWSDPTLEPIVTGWRAGVTTFIDGGDIYTGSIYAKSIAVGTITGEQLTPADRGNLLFNGSFESDKDGDGIPEGWEWVGGSRVTGGYDGTYAVQILRPAAGTNYCIMNYAGPWSAQKYVTFRVMAKSTGATGKIRMCVHFYDATGIPGYLTTHWTDYDCTASSLYKEIIHMSGVPPAGTAFMRVSVENVTSFPAINTLTVDAFEAYAAYDERSIIKLSADRILITGTTYLSSWNKTGTTVIDGAQIYTGSVSTNQICFGVLATDPLPYTAGKMWWLKTAAIDQLRFSTDTTLAGVAIIPKYPIGIGSAPSENLILNPYFEIDTGTTPLTPLYWEYAGSNPPTLSTYLPCKGKNCLYFNCPAGIAYNSSLYTLYPYLIAVKGGRWHLLSAATKWLTGTALIIRVHWMASDKVTEVGYTDMNGGTTLNTWVDTTLRVQAPATACYIRMEIFIYHPGTLSQSYLGEVILSEQRAAVPTAGVVNKDTAATGTATVIPTSWGVITAAWTPTADTDVYFVQLNVMSLTGTAEFRLKVGTSYYPDVNGWALENGTWLFTVPKNVNGVACQFEGQNTGGTKTYTYRRIAWGHSPHTHV